jgi:hypothetical protein
VAHDTEWQIQIGQSLEREEQQVNKLIIAKFILMVLTRQELDEFLLIPYILHKLISFA